MTDQPKPDKDDTPEGYRPPSHIPAYESDVPAPPPATSAFEQQGYGHRPSGTPDQAGEQHTQPLDYGQPTDPYGTPAQYGQQPYTQQPYGQQPYSAAPHYGQPGTPFNAYGQPAYYGVPPEPKGLSIASMCCGIAAFVGLGFFLLPQLAAVILGHMALKREPSGKGMAIAGLVMGYVAIALTILVVVVFFALGLALSGSSNRAYGV
jgi:hypothetical protein